MTLYQVVSLVESRLQSAPGRNRTYDLRFRKPLLYPTELRERGRTTPACGSGQATEKVASEPA